MLNDFFLGSTMSSSAASSTTSTTFIPSILSIAISEKLMKANYPLWNTQVLLAIRAMQLDNLLNGEDLSPEKEISSIVNNMPIKSRNPAHSAWVARDQVVLGYHLSTLTHETLQHVLRCSTVAQVWHTLADLYSLQSHARSVNTQIALATTKKTHLSIADYYSKMCQYAYDLATLGPPLHDDELVAYLLASLDEECNSVFTAVVARVDPISPSELYAQLLNFEQHTHLQALLLRAILHRL
jgi:hypothetical protein